MALPAGDVSPLRSPFGFSPADVAHSPTAYAVKVRCIPRPDRVAPPNYAAARACRLCPPGSARGQCRSLLELRQTLAGGAGKRGASASFESRMAFKALWLSGFGLKSCVTCAGDVARMQTVVARGWHAHRGG